MKTIIRSNKVEVTDSIKDYINKKLAKLDRYFENADELEATVNIRLKGQDELIEITVPTKKFTIRAEEASKEVKAAADLVVDDLYAAIDLVSDKLERQIRKNKTRLNNKYKNVEVPDFVFDYEIDETKENKEKIVKRKDIESKPMDEEEAILQMELINHDFFGFKNVEEDCVSIVYKRKDGHYGIINLK